MSKLIPLSHSSPWLPFASSWVVFPCYVCEVEITWTSNVFNPAFMLLLSLISQSAFFSWKLGEKLKLLCGCYKQNVSKYLYCHTFHCFHVLCVPLWFRQWVSRSLLTVGAQESHGKTSQVWLFCLHQELFAWLPHHKSHCEGNADRT